MFDYEGIEAVDPSKAVRLNFQISHKVLPPRDPSGRQPHQRRTPAAAAAGKPASAPAGVLRMFMATAAVTPQELLDLWESEWHVSYASRIRFVAPPDSPAKYLRQREDAVPAHPAVLRLEGPPSVLTALAHEMRLRDPGAPPVATPGERPSETVVDPPPPPTQQTRQALAWLQERPLCLGQEAAVVGRHRRARGGAGLWHAAGGAEWVPGEQPAAHVLEGQQSAGAQDEEGEALELAVGDRVRLRGLKSQAGLNGQLGTLVALTEGRWKVRLDEAPAEGSSEKLLRPANLQALSSSAAAPRRGTAGGSAGARGPPKRVCYVGTSAGGSTREMNWDDDRGCYQVNVELGADTVEDFQLWIDSDPARCVYPGQDRAGLAGGGGSPAPDGAQPLGPDARSQGRRWRLQEAGREAGCYEVRLFLDSRQVPTRVDWTRLGRLFPAASASRGLRAASAPPQQGSSGPGAARQEEGRRPSNTPLGQWLRAALPGRPDAEVARVQAALAGAGIKAVPALLLALRGGHGSSSALPAAGGGAARTVSSLAPAGAEGGLAEPVAAELREYAARLERLATAPPAGPPAPPPAGGGSRAEAAPSELAAALRDQVLPVQEFEVVHGPVYVRERPSSEAPALAAKAVGERFAGARETFDGWVKLDAALGWVLKDLRGRRGIGATIRPVGLQPLLAAPELAAEPGTQRFRVEVEPHVVLYAAPGRTARVQGVSKCGEELVAEAQTYNGWVKLASRGGWAMAFDLEAEGGAPVRLLRCVSQEEQRARQKELAQSALSRSGAGEEETPAGGAGAGGEAAAEAARSRQARLRMGLCSAAEFRLLEEQAALQALRARVLEALPRCAAAGESRLRELLEACHCSGLEEEAAQLQQALGRRAQDEAAHAPLLEALAVAAASGDAGAVKEARDAAKRGGVPARALARAFALRGC